MTKIRKRLAVIFCFCILLAVPVAAGAEENEMTVAQSYVYDEAGLLSADEITVLNEQISMMHEETGWDIFAVTTDDANGKSAQAYADDFYDVRTTENSDGILVLIDMDNREIYISSCGRAIRYLTDARVERILDAGYAYVSEAEYAECLSAMLKKAAYYYEAGIPDHQYNYDVETGAVSRYHSLTWEEILPVLLLAAGAGIGVYVFVIRSYKLKGGRYDYPYVKYGKVNLTECEDRFIRAHTSHQHIQTDSGRSGGSSSGSGRSSTHTSSSGRSHGGGGRKF